MIFSKNPKKKNPAEEELTQKIIGLTEGTSYSINQIKVYPNSFGNAVIELTDTQRVVRFTDDRRDIYFDWRHKDSQEWHGEELVFSHSEPHKAIYDLLVKAIEDFVKV